jgi:hypothetical protein
MVQCVPYVAVAVAAVCGETKQSCSSDVEFWADIKVTYDCKQGQQIGAPVLGGGAGV